MAASRIPINERSSVSGVVTPALLSASVREESLSLIEFITILSPSLPALMSAMV